MNIEQARFNMIEQQIRPWDVLEPSVLELLSVVKREDFVPAEHRALAFVDTDIPLAGGQSMLSPKVEARLLQDIVPLKHERSLVIGDGAAYFATLLGHRVQTVVLLQSNEQAASASQAALARAHASHVQVVMGRGDQGHAALAPYDLIVLLGSVAQVPQTLFAQLKPQGRLAAIVGHSPVMQATLYTQSPQGRTHKVLFDTCATRLSGFAEPSRFKF
jgi:protein-L-isoaspartate(D-aspartate) O-methyltransferase